MFGHFGLFDVANIDIFSIRSKYFWIFYAHRPDDIVGYCDEKIGQITHGRSVSKGIGISRIPGRGADRPMKKKGRFL